MTPDTIRDILDWLDIFQERAQRDGRGDTKTIGDYYGRGWLSALVRAAVDTVTSPPEVSTRVNPKKEQPKP